MKNFSGNRRVEVLAPAGNAEMMRAAVENGADAVYFGLEDFNARLRADNFSLQELPDTMRYLHHRGVKGYVTLNILIFDKEISQALEIIRRCAESQVDAVLVQDLGLASLAQHVAPNLPLHASTQMTLSSAESIAAAQALGLKLERVVCPRELTLKELAKIKNSCGTELEVFVHGALCVAYSGQCLTSEALGGRSANRGECAQACRLPYDLVVDGTKREIPGIPYLLSPKDLAAHGQISELLSLGVSSLKIEGRLKTPEYVAASVQSYRFAVDSALRGDVGSVLPEKLQKGLAMTFSRGFTSAYLEGTNHQTVVEGRYSSKRGTLLGEVLQRKRQTKRVSVQLSASLRVGEGVLFCPAAGKTATAPGIGGTVSHLFYHGKEVKEILVNDRSREVEIEIFGREFNPDQLSSGMEIWKTSDPKLQAELRSSFSGDEINFRRPITALVQGEIHQPLQLTLCDWEGIAVTCSDSEPLQYAHTHPLTHEILWEQLGRLGNTPFVLTALECSFSQPVTLPFSRLNQLRRRAVEELLRKRLELTTKMTVDVSAKPAAQILLDYRRKFVLPQAEVPVENGGSSAQLSLLCRSMAQVRAACELIGEGCHIARVYTDFEDIRLQQEAAAILPRGKTKFIPATLRIFKPGEEALVLKLLRCEPDAILVRNLAAWHLLAKEAPKLDLIGDYPLNVANEFTARLLLNKGFSLLTPSYDLNIEQLQDLCLAIPADYFEITIQQHMPMFHMEHCVFCRFLSSGTNATNCGRPCEKHEVQLEDRKGYRHVLLADVGCRNTLYNSVPQSAAEYVPSLNKVGVRHYRLDFLRESAEEMRETYLLYRDLLLGLTPPQRVWQALRASSKLGVTRGSLDHELSGNKLYAIGRSRKAAHGKTGIRP